MLIKSKSIRTRYIFSGVAICLVSLLLVSIFSYLVSYNITAEQSNLRIHETAMKNASQLDSWFKENGNIIENMVEDIEISGDFSQGYLYKLMNGKYEIYKKNVLDYYIGFEDPERKLISGNGWKPDDDYDCHSRKWYIEAMDENKIIYTEPYVDAQTGKMVITIAKKIERDGKAIGVLAADIVITNVIDVVKGYSMNQDSYAFLLDNNGNIITHPNKRYLPSDKGLKNIKNVSGTDYSKLVTTIKNGKLQIIDMKDYDGKPKYFILSKIDSCGWIFGIAIMPSEYKKPLYKLLYGFGISLFISMIIGLGIMLKLTSGMVKPIKTLSDTVKGFSDNNLSLRSSINTEDEIGELGKNFNQMADIIEEHSIFLENKVAERTRELQEKNNNIMESIDYAQRLQRAILPSIPKRLGIPKENCFVIWKPRDVVGGDMYWCRGDENNALLVVADCTGHGVPGALMTMTLSSILDGLPRNWTDTKPSEVLSTLDARLKETLRQQEGSSTANDGADIAMCLIDKINRKILFAGAKLSLFVAHDGEILEYKGAKHSVGYSWEKNVIFEDHEIEWNNENLLYITTDGLLDQNVQEEKGGLGRKEFIKLLQSICKKPLNEQKMIIEAMISERLAKVEQRDDITVIGLKM